MSLLAPRSIEAFERMAEIVDGIGVDAADDGFRCCATVTLFERSASVSLSAPAPRSTETFEVAVARVIVSASLPPTMVSHVLQRRGVHEVAEGDDVRSCYRDRSVPFETCAVKVMASMFEPPISVSTFGDGAFVGAVGQREAVASGTEIDAVRSRQDRSRA